MHRAILLSIPAALLLLAGCATQSQRPALTGGSNDSFLGDALRGSTGEVDLSKLALERAQDPRVKEFARKMVEDHGRMNDDLKALADKKGLSISASLDDDQKATLKRFQGLSGPEFDREYMACMVADHASTVRTFDAKAASGSDPDVSALARKALPTLRDHLQMARDLAKEIGAPAAPSGEATVAPPPPV